MNPILIDLVSKARRQDMISTAQRERLVRQAERKAVSQRNLIDRFMTLFGESLIELGCSIKDRYGEKCPPQEFSQVKSLF